MTAYGTPGYSVTDSAVYDLTAGIQTDVIIGDHRVNLSITINLGMNIQQIQAQSGNFEIGFELLRGGSISGYYWNGPLNQFPTSGNPADTSVTVHAAAMRMTDLTNGTYGLFNFRPYVTLFIPGVDQSQFAVADDHFVLVDATGVTITMQR
jgi:hypothetical protein